MKLLGIDRGGIYQGGQGVKTERTKGEWIVTESLSGDIYIGSENISIAKVWSPTAKADAEYICRAVNNYDRLVSAATP